MNLTLGIVLVWLGASMITVAVHDQGLTTPWDAYTALMARIRGET